jgi:hypothetical protein
MSMSAVLCLLFYFINYLLTSPPLFPLPGIFVSASLQGKTLRHWNKEQAHVVLQGKILIKEAHST